MITFLTKSLDVRRKQNVLGFAWFPILHHLYFHEIANIWLANLDSLNVLEVKFNLQFWIFN